MGGAGERLGEAADRPVVETALSLGVGVDGLGGGGPLRGDRLGLLCPHPHAQGGDRGAVVGAGDST